MSRKFRKALKELKQTYDFPYPTHKDKFFQELERGEQKKTSLFLALKNKIGIFQMTVVFSTVIVMVGGYGVYQNYGSSRGSVPIEEPVLTTEQTYLTDFSHSSVFSGEETQPTSCDTDTKTSFTSTTTSPDIPKESQTSVGGESILNRTQTITVVPQDNADIRETHQVSQQKVTAAVTKETQAVQTTKVNPHTSHTVAVSTNLSDVTTRTIPVQTVSSQTESTQPPSFTDEPASDYMDYRVTPAYQYEKTDNIVDLEFAGDSEPSDPVVGPTDSNTAVALWKQSVGLSDCIVSGTVTALVYTRVENVLWTQVDIEITEVYKGTLYPGDKISIYEPGGYMPLSEYLMLHPENAWMFDMTDDKMRDATCFDSGMHRTYSEPGETCLYFLKGSTGNIPEGAYQYTKGTDDSRFRKEGDIFMNVLNGSYTILSNELIAYLWNEEQ